MMKFTFTHPMHSHPYNAELVTGSGIATVAAAAEAAGLHGFVLNKGIGAHLLAKATFTATRWTRSWQWDSPRPARRRCD